MDKRFFIKPGRPGLIVRDPLTGQPLPGQGAEKPRCSYWLRRLRDGDVVLTEPAKPAKGGAK